MIKNLLAALILLVSASAMAEPQVGVEYNQTQQLIPTENPAKIEVIELFWYGCPHCYVMEPLINAWAKKQAKDVEFHRVPGVPRPDWAPMAKAFYTLETLGLTEKLHSQLFEAIHKQRALKPDDEAATVAWITAQSGLDRKKVEEAFYSFSTNTKLTRAMQLFRASGATGVPSLIIDGKYLTSSTLAGGNEESLKVADYLIAKVRQEKTAKR